MDPIKGVLLTSVILTLVFLRRLFLLFSEMWPTESDLEPLDAIIDRMNPISGFPYPMKSAINQGFPRGVGDPWIGAYTKNGYWFKLSLGGEDEWKEVANEMWYRNEFLVDTNTFDLYQKAMSSSGEVERNENLKLLVAKNIRGEVLGIALLCKNENAKFSTIGPIFVQEDFRHVGIGTILMKEIIQNEGDIGFNSSKVDSIDILILKNNSFFLVSYLLPTTERFKLEPRNMRTFGRIRVKNPSGFASLKDDKPGVEIVYGTELTGEQWEKVVEFGESCTNEKRNWKAFIEERERNSLLVAAFEEGSDDCVGISVLREILNEDGRIPDLMVAPLYAKSTSIAEVLLQKTLKKYYNPEDDYDFDVDYLAIYRRSINFFIFSSCESVMFPLLKKLSGSDGKMEKDRLTFQTCSNFQLPAVNHDLIFCLSDPNIYMS
ncbi:hypothetical protein CRE_13560 [Caenorhabditis remanei]|uniref:N-acetyltransferase domain-containing protein n=1 Tax=Caenorhabditis remanei TaxID=31234 RepID=E3MRB3_CAERE|nr:hypothetical protein CRE_13560 [Caenorhabditis remanei]